MKNYNLKMFHHSIIVTSNNIETIKIIHLKAKELFPHLTTEIVYSNYNHIVSFFVAPDGGKENKKVSNAHDILRDELLSFIENVSHNLDKDVQLHVSLIGYYDDIKEIR